MISTLKSRETTKCSNFQTTMTSPPLNVELVQVVGDMNLVTSLCNIVSVKTRFRRYPVRSLPFLLLLVVLSVPSEETVCFIHPPSPRISVTVCIFLVVPAVLDRDNHTLLIRQLAGPTRSATKPVSASKFRKRRLFSYAATHLTLTRKRR